jgi:hypothetical protein
MKKHNTRKTTGWSLVVAGAGWLALASRFDCLSPLSCVLFKSSSLPSLSLLSFRYKVERNLLTIMATIIQTNKPIHAVHIDGLVSSSKCY